MSLADQADVMVYDSAYTDEEYPKFKGWGHSTWQEALKIAEKANVKNTFLFHHDPSHNDERMDQIASEVAPLIQLHDQQLKEKKFQSSFFSHSKGLVDLR